MHIRKWVAAMGVFAVAATMATAAAAPAAEQPTADTTKGEGLQQVVKGVTTQAELLRLFGGPNLTTADPAGREIWIYERTVAQTDSNSSSKSVSGGVDFGAFWSVGSAKVEASKSQSSQAQSNRTSVNTVTVTVTFAADHTVADYEVHANYF